MHKLFGLSYRRVAKLKRRNWLEWAARELKRQDFSGEFRRIERERRLGNGPVHRAADERSNAA